LIDRVRVLQTAYCFDTDVANTAGRRRQIFDAIGGKRVAPEDSAPTCMTRWQRIFQHMPAEHAEAVGKGEPPAATLQRVVSILLRTIRLYAI
jgi:hypothetical protein